MTNYKRNKLSNLVSETLPDFVSSSYPKFVTFVEEYYKWLESNENPYFAPLSLNGMIDIDQTVDEFVDYFKTYIFPKFPDRYKSAKGDVLDIKKVLKKSRDLYKAKGTEDSIRYVIRLLFDVYSEIYVPSEDIFVASGGRWYQPTVVRCLDGNSTRNAKLRNLRVTFHNTFGERVASGRIADIKQFSRNGKKLVEFDIDQLIGSVPYPGTIRTTTPEGESVSINLISMVSSITVENGGSDYKPDDPVTINSPVGGVGAKASVQTVDKNGKIRSIRIDDPGLNYFKINGFFLGSVGVTSETGTGASGFEIQTSSSVKRPGVYQNNNGQLSSTEKLQDNYRYQNHSYVIRTEANLSEYKNTIKDLVHPAGKLVLGDYFVYRQEKLNAAADGYALRNLEEPFFANYFPYTIATIADGATTEIGIFGVLSSEFDLRGISTEGLDGNESNLYIDYFPYGYDGATGYTIVEDDIERTVLGEGISGGWDVQNFNRFGGIGATQEFFARKLVGGSLEYTGTTLPGWPSDGVDFWIVHPHPNTWHQSITSGISWGAIPLNNFIRTSYSLSSPPDQSSESNVQGLSNLFG